MKTSMEGLGYITALLNRLYQQTDCERIVAPRYIFRGITQRHFTSSDSIKEHLKDPDYDCVHEKFDWRKFAFCHNAEADLDGSPIINDELWMKIESEYYNKIKNEFHRDLNRFIKNKHDDKDYPEQVLQFISKDERYKFLEPQYIRSGAAVRLKNMGKRTKHDYIGYIINLISELKTRYPHEYRGYSDLEILADLQHKGGASCLVDFSTNFLISLWFATQNYSSQDEMGYMFCYDVNRDAIEGDSLTILGSHKSSSSIESLINETVKSTRFSGIQFNKFWFWKPDNINNRITRQDSVFVFGIEKFKTSKPSVIVLPIPPSWKYPIQSVLKDFFGLYGETIFADADGLSSTNNKFLPVKPQTQYFYEDRIFSKVSNCGKFDFHLFQKGMSALWKSQYSIALEFFSSFEGTNAKYIKARKFSHEMPITLHQKMLLVELQYSKGICHRHLKHLKAAVNCFEEAFSECIGLKGSLGESDTNTNIISVANNSSTTTSSESNYVFNKLLKILEDYIGVLYDLHYFNDAEIVIDRFREYLENNGEFTDMTNDLLQTAKNEIQTLILLYSLLKPKGYAGCIIDQPKEINEIKNIKYSDWFITVLNKYFWIIQTAILQPKSIEIMSKSGKDVLTDTLDNAITSCVFSQPISSSNPVFTDWDLSDITDALNSIVNHDTIAVEPKILRIISIWTDKVEDCLRRTDGRKRSEIY